MPGSPEDWLTQAQSCIARANLGPRVDAIGRVESIGDGVAMVSGLPDSRLDELLYLARGQTGFVHTLDRDRIGCVLLDDAAQVEAGDTVTGSGEVVRVPVGEALLGRVVDPLGRPLDGGAPIRARRFDPVERPAPAIIERDLVVQPVQTGTLAIDAMFAIGRGQRELILGDRATGKTALAVDTIINQRTSDMICVYVAIGQKSSAHREIALLIGQPPGREAYPGDVFFLHSRLLERAARLSTEKGGGSLTALPIAETDAGNVSAYIPTNLISITDGQIILDAKLFAQGHKPAIDVGTSVSRVGGKTQLRVLRDASGTMRLDYAQFLELEMFTRFGEQPEPRVRAQIERGKRLRALLVQPLSSPLRVVDQVALAVALGEGLLDGMVVSEIPSLRARLPAWIDDHVPDLCAQIERTGQIDTAQRSALITTVKALIESQPAGSAS